MKTKTYFFSYGPDSRHLHDVVVCDFLRDARAIAKAVQPRAYKITSLEYEGGAYDCGSNEKLIDERIF